MNVNETILRLFVALSSLDGPEVKEQAFRNIDWPVLVRAIKASGMAGFFSDLITGYEQSLNITPDAAMELKKAARQTAVHNAFYEDQASKTLRGLSALGAECIILKGFSYMADIYGNTSARKMSDIDLLIHPAGRLMVRDYLLSEGFMPYIDPAFRGSAEEFLRVTEFTGESHYTKKIGVLSLHVDLHWKMQANFDGYPINEALALDTLPWWNNTGTVEIGDSSAQRLRPDMQFIHMAVHFALHHQFNGLRWFIELCLFVHKFSDALNMESIRDIVISPDCRKMLGITLRMIEETMGNPYTSRIKWRDLVPAGALLPGEYAFYKKCLLRNGRSQIAVYLCMLLSPSTMAGRGRMLNYFLFNPQAIMFWRVSGSSVSKWLQPFYILYRLAREAFRRRHA